MSKVKGLKNNVLACNSSCFLVWLSTFDLRLEK